MKIKERMFNDKLKVHITPDWNGQLRMHIFYLGENGEVAKLAKPVTLEFHPWDEKKINDPTMIMSPNFGNDFLNALRNMLEKEGFRSTKEDQMEGKMNAMKDHLRDMRRLVFKDKVIEMESEKQKTY